MDIMETATIRRGALSYVLQLARITGALPVALKVVRNGYRISVSSYQLAYSYCIITTFNIIGGIVLFFNLKQSIIHRIEACLSVAQLLTCMLTCAIGYMGAKRMKYMIYHLNILEKTRTGIKYDWKSVTEDKKNIWISSIIITMYVILISMDIILNLMRPIKWGFVLILKAVHCFEYPILLLLQIQIVILNFEVFKVLQELKEKLRFLVTLADNDHLTTSKARIINNGVRSLTQGYVSVCDVVTKINNAEGLYMFIMYASFQLFSVFVGYRMILVLNAPSDLQYRVIEIVLQCFWCLTIIFRTTFFVEPFYRIAKEAVEIKALLAQLMVHMTLSGKHVSIEIDVMVKQISLIAPIYCPLGIYTLNRSLITNTYNAIVAWLVYIFSK